MQRVVFSESSRLSGMITAPSSKSYSHRLLFLSLIAYKPIHISNLLLAQDVQYTIDVCKQLGMRILNKEKYEPPKNLKSDGNIFNCGNSGTTVRFLIGLSLAVTGRLYLTGEFFTRKRPIIPMLMAMKSIGTIFKMEEHGVMVETSHITSSVIKVPGHFSSQFVSGLIFGIVALRLRPDITDAKNFHFSHFTIATTTPVVSLPYLELTVHILQEFGIDLVLRKSPDGCAKIIIPMQNKVYLVKDNYQIPGDYSSISSLYCAAALFGENSVTIEGLSQNGVHPDSELIEILRKMGVKSQIGKEGITIYPRNKSEQLSQSATIDLKNNPDLFPALCILGAYSACTTKLTNIHHIRFKESDRVEVMIQELRRFGIRVEEKENTLIIYGQSLIELRSSHIITDIRDHRILMALCILAVGLQFNNYTVTIENTEYIADSYPRFFKDLRSQNASFKVE